VLGLSDGTSVNIAIPDGFDGVAFAARLCASGMTTYIELRTMSIRQVYEVALLVDWQDMTTTKANLIARRRQKRNV